MILETLLQKLARYNRVFYPDQMLGVVVTFSIFPDGSGWLQHYITGAVILEFNNPEKLMQFLDDQLQGKEE